MWETSELYSQQPCKAQTNAREAERLVKRSAWSRIHFARQCFSKQLQDFLIGCNPQLSHISH